MHVRHLSFTLLGTLATCLLFAPLPATAAETICTFIVQSPEYPIPLNERETDRQLQSHLLPGFVAEGDSLAAGGEHEEAIYAYTKVFSGFQYRGVYFGADRCLSTDFYQGAAQKLRNVASELAAQREAKGFILDEAHVYGGEHQRGSLRLYLLSNQYDRFIERAFSYAEKEIVQRDIDGPLMALISQRLGDIERYQNAGALNIEAGYVNDQTPLLDEELAAFTKLARFDEKLAAHLAPLYPKMTEHFLAEETRYFDEFGSTEGALKKGLSHQQATDALELGISRLNKHPQQVARLKARANVRGETLMKMAGPDTSSGMLVEVMSKNNYGYASDYFEIAENPERLAEADRLSREREASTSDKMEASIRTDFEKMQKSNEEKSAFQDETDAMAEEFGFDLDE